MPTRKPFNQPLGEYMDMIWEKKGGEERERSRRQGARSPLVKQTQ